LGRLRYGRRILRMPGRWAGWGLAAKGQWGYPGRWMELWRPGLEVSPGFVRDNKVYVAVSGEEPVGFYALVGGGRGLYLEHLWTCGCCRPGSDGPRSEAVRARDASCARSRG
jgi:hypothetical protein